MGAVKQLAFLQAGTKEQKDTQRLSLSTLAEAIRHYRVQRGWTQKQLAQAARSSQTRISGYEKMEQQPPIDTLADIEKALEIPGMLWAAYTQQPAPGRMSIASFLDEFSLSSEEQIRVLDYIDLLIRARNGKDMGKSPLQQRIQEVREQQQKEEKEIKQQAQKPATGNIKKGG